MVYIQKKTVDRFSDQLFFYLFYTNMKESAQHRNDMKQHIHIFVFTNFIFSFV